VVETQQYNDIAPQEAHVGARVMFNRSPAATAPQIVGARPRSSRTSIVEFLRSGLRSLSARPRRRREREELYEFLASDHRIAADIGYRHHQQE
jgi:hypothetical protein